MTYLIEGSTEPEICLGITVALLPGLSRTTLATAKSKIHDQSLSMTQTQIGTLGSPTCLLTDEFFKKERKYLDLVFGHVER